jgi:hypothetical protein
MNFVCHFISLTALASAQTLIEYCIKNSNIFVWVIAGNTDWCFQFITATACHLLQACFLLGLFFDPEDEAACSSERLVDFSGQCSVSREYNSFLRN